MICTRLITVLNRNKQSNAIMTALHPLQGLIKYRHL